MNPPPIPAANHSAEEIEAQRKDQDNYEAANELLRPNSGWNRLIEPLFKEELADLEKTILSGECENHEAYVTACGTRLVLIKALETPQRLYNQSKENMNRRRQRGAQTEE